MASGSGGAEVPTDAGEYTYVSEDSVTVCKCQRITATYQSKGWKGKYTSPDGAIVFDGPVDAEHSYTVFATPAATFSDELCTIPSTAALSVTGSAQGSAGGVTVSCTYDRGRIERTFAEWMVVLEGKVTLSDGTNTDNSDTIEVREGVIDVANCVTTDPAGFPPASCPSDGDKYVAVESP